MKKDIKLLFEDSKTLEVYYGTTVRDVIRELADENVIALRVNGKVVDADYELTGDSYINYIYVSDKIGQRIYLKGLQYVYILAVKELYGDRSEKVHEIYNKKKGNITPTLLTKILLGTLACMPAYDTNFIKAINLKKSY